MRFYIICILMAVLSIFLLNKVSLEAPQEVSITPQVEHPVAPEALAVETELSL